MQQILQTHAHELSHERSIFQSKLVCSEEAARRLRVQIILLGDEREDLYAQLLQSDTRSDELELLLDDAHHGIRVLEEDDEQLRNELRLKNREVETLKVCDWARLLWKFL